MIAASLQSGSNGNCIYVECDGVGLLFDAGICGAVAARRLAALGRDIRSVRAVIISHDHADHIRYAGVYQRKYGIPLYVTARTLCAAEAKLDLGKLSDIRLFLAGGTLSFGEVSVRTLPTPHDGQDGAVFVVSNRQKSLGILTDLGHVFRELPQVISSLDAVFIESNYDPVLLAKGPYPPALKRRIEGAGGHISNYEAAELLCEGARLQWACLAHLSETNNYPSLALETHRKIVPEGLVVHTASRYSSSGLLSV
ncbi:MAG: MBL fold metallo-hydrolase [Alphaproteobacteria bacterium]|uniref:MBL fold metallo-hydrolase n=1 Tax=Candidatus Nitrobium versatile TaxID=2884831 RepID=A0A953M398_9BACT|nr:MBL fold metallo-hydrolase [Candidatus Nitrobium versatile]